MVSADRTLISVPILVLMSRRTSDELARDHKVDVASTPLADAPPPFSWAPGLSGFPTLSDCASRGSCRPAGFGTTPPAR
jgi:hypothetical protein